MKKLLVSLAAARVELDESLQLFRQLGDRQSIAGQVLTLEQAIQEMLSLERVQDRKALSLTPGAETLYLNAFGPMHVQKGKQALTAWPYAKVKELLFYLLSYPARTKAQIGLAVWPDASPAQLRNSLGTTLYHLRRVLGNSECILFDEDQYRFNRTLPYRFDVEVFESHRAEAHRLQATAPEQATILLQEAIQLYQGDFLEDCVEGEWFLLARQELWRKYLDTLLDLGALLFSEGHYNAAAEAYRRAIENENVLEAAHRGLMRCYARSGERGRALRQYQALQHIMQTEFGSAPAAESVALYERLKRGEEA